MNKKSFSTNLYLMYFIALLPLIVFGFYKNGIQLYSKGYVDVIAMFKPIIMIFMSACGMLLGNVIKDYKKNKKFSKKILKNYKNNIIEAILVAMILPLKSSPLIIFVVSLIFGLILNGCKLNRIALMYILIQSINRILGLHLFNNPYEMNTVLNYDGIDLFLGMGSGGICSTCIILMIIGLLFLSWNKLYKKEIVYSALGSFILTCITANMIMGEYTEIFTKIFGYNILFILIFILPNLYSSSYTVKGQVASGILVGILTYFISLISPYNSAVISILIISPLNGILDRLTLIK